MSVDFPGALRPPIFSDSRRWHSNEPTNPSTGPDSGAYLEFSTDEIAIVFGSQQNSFIRNAYKFY